MGTPMMVGLTLEAQPAVAARRVSLRVEKESLALVAKINGVQGAVEGVCLGGVGVWCGDGATPSRSATSLVGSAGTDSTWSAQGVGGSRGVVVVEVIPSTCTGFTAKGEGTNEFTCPLASERGGTEIQTLSFSFGVITG